MSVPARPGGVDMVVDSSALIALVLDEPGSASIARHLAEPGRAVISAANLMEATMVATSRGGSVGAGALNEFITVADIVIMPVDDHQVAGATRAWQRFGRGRHPAKLNFGDCFAYALAEHFDAPLLCVGDDFPQTDLRVVPL